MSTSSRVRTRRICLDALLTAAAMMLSYLESLLPIAVLIPLPGFKPGLANLVTVAAFVYLSKTDAAVISALRIALMGLLFGSVTSLYFSALGGLCAYLALLLSPLLLKKCSFLGVSLFGAAAHNFGQSLAAATVFGPVILSTYLPYLLLAAVVSGLLTGVILNLAAPTLGRALRV